MNEYVHVIFAEIQKLLNTAYIGSRFVIFTVYCLYFPQFEFHGFRFHYVLNISTATLFF